MMMRLIIGSIFALGFLFSYGALETPSNTTSAVTEAPANTTTTEISTEAPTNTPEIDTTVAPANATAATLITVAPTNTSETGTPINTSEAPTTESTTEEPTTTTSAPSTAAPDLCDINNGECDDNATCAAQGGNVTCTCKSGYEKMNATCMDINECSTGNDNCHANASCINNIPLYSCACVRGYAGDGRNCTVSCTNWRCEVGASCRIINNKATCTCDGGYYETSSGACSIKKNAFSADIKLTRNFTEELNDPTSVEFMTLASNVESSLLQFIQTRILNVDAIDVTRFEPGSVIAKYDIIMSENYVAGGTNPTQLSSVLTQGIKSGNFSSLEADQTFEPVINHFNKCDFDNTNDCRPDRATCTNNATTGNYICACKNGYTDNGTECTDINECESKGTYNCHASASCVNTEGSYDCECNTGFTKQGTTCVDINECDAGTDECHADAICTNNRGSYSCLCKTRFEGNGRNCTCKTGIEFTGSNCTAVDKCGGRCGKYGTCTTSDPGSGSYKCECLPDYEEKDGACVKDDDLALKVALPIVLILLLVIFILLCLRSMKKRQRHADYEMAETTGISTQFDNKTYVAD